MAIRTEMTWEASKSRWRKMHRGKIFTVSCTQLGCEPTQEDSYRAANQWWRIKLAELTLAGQPTPPLNPSVRITGVPTVTDKRNYLERSQLEAIERGDPARVWETAQQLSRLEDQDVPTATTVGTLRDEWLKKQIERVNAKKMKPRSYTNVAASLRQFVSHVGENKSPGSINESTISRYYSSLVNLFSEGAGAGNLTDRMNVATRFVRWLWSEGHLDIPPRNLESDWSFRKSAPVIKFFTADEIAKLMETAKGQDRLHILLQLNCGMTAVDVSCLLDSEVDWVNGRIIRQRTKTRDRHASAAPTVDYPLWPATWRLLQEYRSHHKSGVVLVNSAGQPMRRESVTPNGKVHITDTLSKSLSTLWRRAGVRLSAKFLRKTGASTLKTHREFKGYVTLYLANSPKGIADTHYAAPDRAGFDEAITWLGSEFSPLGRFAR